MLHLQKRPYSIIYVTLSIQGFTLMFHLVRTDETIGLALALGKFDAESLIGLFETCKVIF